MRLLIVGEHVGKGIDEERPIYRGTYRDRPYYCDQLGEDHEVNKAFFWFIESGREHADSDLDFVSDLSKATSLVLAYNCYSGKEFDLVEAIIGDEKPLAGEEFLGYDLSRGFFNSLLWYGLDICYRQTAGWDSAREDLLRLIQPLVCLVERYFKPKLNANGLFDDYSTARWCLECMTSIQTICPDWFESGENNYEVVGLHRVKVEQPEQAEQLEEAVTV